eukprot:CAMPEP_0204824584 /NCGR_PEP_ID=MMETSP1346-20131115/2575_1 /ASSEMBLY_ACC=CAM_ASM_000771 /TAXON_ID=215587 /ORGANISM="Aplanochytrium stocchinoi, Strain GSBS06" /LENGTH=162 /DNA_ID=CAMNT_0051951795 /DNA_START=13 /DNA_END=498 /DNA_ORIENTATION=-
MTTYDSSSDKKRLVYEPCSEKRRRTNTRNEYNFSEFDNEMLSLINQDLLELENESVDSGDLDLTIPFNRDDYNKIENIVDAGKEFDLEFPDTLPALNGIADNQEIKNNFKDTQDVDFKINSDFTVEEEHLLFGVLLFKVLATGVLYDYITVDKNPEETCWVW